MVPVRHNEKGVTLIETMIALLIFMIATLGYISLEANLARSSAQSAIVSQAVFVGQSTIEALRTLPIDDLIDSTEQTAMKYDQYGNADPAADIDGITYTVNWTVTTPEAAPTTRRVNLEVSWNLGGEFDNVLQLSFVRSR